MTKPLLHSLFLALAVLFGTFDDTVADFNDGIQNVGNMVKDTAFRNDDGELHWWVFIFIGFILIIVGSIVLVAYCFFCMKRHTNDNRCQGSIFPRFYCGSIVTDVAHFFGRRKRNTKDGESSQESTHNESFEADVEFGTRKSSMSHTTSITQTDKHPSSFSWRNSRSIYSQEPNSWPQTIVSDNNDNDDSTTKSHRSIYSHDPASWQEICNIAGHGDDDDDDDDFSEADSDDIRRLEYLEVKYAEKVEKDEQKKRKKEERRSQRELQKKSERDLQKKSERELQKKSKRELQKKSERELQKKSERDLQKKSKRDLQKKSERKLQKKSERELQKKSKRALEAERPPSNDDLNSTEKLQKKNHGEIEAEHPPSKDLISIVEGKESSTNGDFYYVE